MPHPRLTLVFGFVLLSACSAERERPPVTPNNNSNNNSSNNNSNNNTSNQRPCGNGVLNGLEACDGAAFANGAACSDYNLGDGDVSCNASCKVGFSACSLSDYCTANNLYDNGQCDACEALGGVRDPDCETVCGADGTCGDRYDPLVGQWTCRRIGMPDPDCGMCGNGIIEGNEICDRQAVPPDRFRCEEWDYLPGGEITCNVDCTPSFRACGHSICGNGVKEGAEVCDSTDLSGATCESRGFAGGSLSCSPICTYNDAACIAPGCGNGILEPDQGEACDGATAVPSCQELGFAAGTTTCGGACQVDTSACVNPGCGNSVIESPLEECEGSDLAGQSCESLGFLQGNLGCSDSSCTFDTSSCVPTGCGNEIIEPSEQCEGTNHAGQTCESLGFLQGTLGCSSTSCAFDTSACISPGCGNSLIEAGETCDGTNLQNQSCTSLGFTGGTLGCAACLFDTTTCSGTRNTCGNNVVEGDEFCDGNNFSPYIGSSCAGFGFPGGGNLSCASDCTLDYSSCEIWTDACDYNNLYVDGVCQDCQEFHPVANVDSDCASCGSDGTCIDAWAIGGYSCNLVSGAHDPDCGCGNGVLEPARANGTYPEICEGNQFVGNLSNCTDWGFTGGLLSCSNGCDLDFTQCF